MSRLATRTVAVVTRWALFAIMVALLWAWPTPAGPTVAHAEEPVTLSPGQVTDDIGAVDDRRNEVDAALTELAESRGVQLFVVYVTGFSEASAQEWTEQTAIDNGLGRSDMLLAVATADRQYAVSVDPAFPLSDAQLDEVAQTAIEPPLRENDYAGAAIGAARGYQAILGGDPVQPVTVQPGEAIATGGGTAGWWLIGLIVLVVAGAVAGAWWWRRHRRNRPPEPEAPGLSLSDLDLAASRRLLDTDDAVRTSEQELGFATAEFGDAPVARFAETLDAAKRDLHDSFLLRQRLDDSEPESDDARRTMLTEIIERCTRANERLDAVSAEFDDLRDLVKRAPEAIAALEESVRGVEQRINGTRQVAAELTGRYPVSVLETVADNLGEAQDRVTFTREQLTRAGDAVADAEPARAAVSVRAGEEAIGQAGQLLDAVERRADELRRAEAALPDMLAEVDKDVAEAEAAGGTESGGAIAGAAAAAVSITRTVRADLAAGSCDPLAALRRLEEADAALDQALAGVRDAAARRRRAAASLDQVLLSASSSVDAAEDFINTHRGGVGTAARTRLAEARRRLERARAGSAADPVAALGDAQRADRLAVDAADLAQQDVHGFGGGGFAGGGFSGGGISGGGFSGHGGSAGAVLGGILIGGMLGGRGGRGGGMGPGSFGGGGTRGRRGAGGRF